MLMHACLVSVHCERYQQHITCKVQTDIHRTQNSTYTCRYLHTHSRNIHTCIQTYLEMADRYVHTVRRRVVHGNCGTWCNTE